MPNFVTILSLYYIACTFPKGMALLALLDTFRLLCYQFRKKMGTRVLLFMTSVTRRNYVCSRLLGRFALMKITFIIINSL